MNDSDAPTSKLPNARQRPVKGGRCRRATIVVAGTVILLLVAGIIGSSWFGDRAAGNQAVSPQTGQVDTGTKEMTAAEIMRAVHFKETSREHDLTGRIRKGRDKIPVMLYRRTNHIQFQYLKQKEKEWKVFHMRHGDVDSGQLELFEMADGKTLRFPDEKLGTSIGGADITHEDIAMPFLYWPGATLQGSENIKGQDCWKIRVQNPGTAGNYALVYMWIHKEAYCLMQVVGYNGKNPAKALKRMQVQGIMSMGTAGILTRQGRRSLIIQSARFATYDPVARKTTGISYLEFDKPQPPPRRPPTVNPPPGPADTPASRPAHPGQ